MALAESWRAFGLVILIALVAAPIWNMTRNWVAFSSDGVTVGGRILDNTTWTYADSPYLIASDVVVDSGKTLTIEPGVVIRFEGDLSITVNGSLYAAGTKDAPIVFSSNSAGPKAGDWDTIMFMGSKDNSLLVRNSIIQHARNGITVSGLGKALVEDSVIVHNLLSGIHADGIVDLMIKDNIIEHNGNGVSTSGEHVSGIIVVGNSIRFTEKATHFQAWAAQGATISNVTVCGNIVSSNEKGIFFYIWAGFVFDDVSLIYDVLISENEVSSNAAGIHLYSGGPYYGCIRDLVISSNRISGNNVGVYLHADTHSQRKQFDVMIFENIVSHNTHEGFHISGGIPIGRQGIKTNVTCNMIAYNNIGILYEGDTDNVASYNDIYNNNHGMNVTGGATVNAENNYWGHDNGPFPAGDGNSVNGDGVDLDFVPYLSSPAVNKRPIARIDANKSLLAVNENVVFNASDSTDDMQIDRFFFDFGDGTKSGWSTDPVAIHAYSSPGAFNVSLNVADDLAFENSNTAALTVVVQSSLVVSMSFDTRTLYSNEGLAVNVYVTDGLNPVPDADVKLYSNNIGVFSPSEGRTNEEGNLTASYLGPSVSEQTVVVVTANASKEGYWGGQGQGELTILPKRSSLNFDFIWIIVGTALLMILIIAYVARKK